MMENLTISWVRWFTIILSFLLAYALLYLLHRAIEKYATSSNLSTRIKSFLRAALIALEPIGIGIILATFALIYPLVHAPLVLILVILAYLPLKNYVSGRFLLLNNSFAEGQRIRVSKNKTGTIQKVNRLGLSLQIKEGVSFINYTSLIEEGFVMLEGERLEGINYLRIIPTDKVGENGFNTLKNKLFANPYIDWFYQPDLSISSKEEDQPVYKATLRVRKDQHLQDLIDLIREWGYQCKPINK